MKMVKAKSLEDYLDIYYKKNRRTPTLLDSYREELHCYGYVCTSEHDNVTGEFICWTPNKKLIKNKNALKTIKRG